MEKGYNKSSPFYAFILVPLGVLFEFYLFVTLFKGSSLFNRMVLLAFLTAVGFNSAKANEAHPVPRMVSISEVEVQGHNFNIVIIDGLMHGTLYQRLVPFRFPLDVEFTGAMDRWDYMEYANDLAKKAIEWIDINYERRGVSQQGEVESEYVKKVVNVNKVLKEDFTLVMVTEINDLDKIVAAFRVSRVGPDGLIPLERNQKEKLPRVWGRDESGGLRGPPVEFKGLVVDRNYKKIVGVDWFTVLLMTVGPLTFKQNVYLPETGRWEAAVPQKIYLEAFKKMTSIYEPMGFKVTKTSSVSEKLVIMESDWETIATFPKKLQENRASLDQLKSFKFTKGFADSWLPISLRLVNLCKDAFTENPKKPFYWKN